MNPVFKTMTYIDASEISKILNVKNLDFAFLEEAENDSFQTLSLEDWRLSDLKEELAFLEEKGLSSEKTDPYRNEIKLINYIKSLGYKDKSIQVQVSW